MFSHQQPLSRLHNNASCHPEKQVLIPRGY